MPDIETTLRRELARSIRESDEAAHIGVYDKRTHVAVPVELLYEAQLALTGTLPGTCTQPTGEPCETCGGTGRSGFDTKGSDDAVD